jgi:hypothetical protein|tara:strand:- start:161 stop:544 length:384 start_codon:yes stop_codon:yes gene_type:complete
MEHTFIDSSKWVPIHTLPGFECCIEYYVSSDGEVKSTKGGIDKILKPSLKSNGYLSVNLTQRIGRGKNLTVHIHRLVALAFIGHPPTPMGRHAQNSIIQFIDGNRSNCSVDNLRWVKVAHKNKPFAA